MNWMPILTVAGCLLAFGVWTLVVIMIGLILGYRLNRGEEPKINAASGMFPLPIEEQNAEEVLGEEKPERNRWTA